MRKGGNLNNQRRSLKSRTSGTGGLERGGKKSGLVRLKAPTSPKRSQAPRRREPPSGRTRSEGRPLRAESRCCPTGVTPALEIPKLSTSLDVSLLRHKKTYLKSQGHDDDNFIRVKGIDINRKSYKQFF